MNNFTNVWDDPDMKTNSDFVKFETVGDTCTGKILNITKKVWDDGTVSPQLTLDTAEGERTLTAGQARLKAALAEQRPAIGDTIKVTFTSLEKRVGGKTLKHFDVAVKRGIPTADF